MLARCEEELRSLRQHNPKPVLRPRIPFPSGCRLTLEPVPTDQVPAATVQIVKGLCSIPPTLLTMFTGWLDVPTRLHIMIRTHKCA